MKPQAKFAICVLAITSLLFSVISADSEPMPQCFLECGSEVIGCAGKCVTEGSSQMLQCITDCGQTNLDCLGKCTGFVVPHTPIASPVSYYY
ncbi:hypothetical protein BVRB_5g114460 [Beta vulgaris subsp. vulgaris]|nr:hypothetical protein BVRB_5g114460 [Beta vulgaris subsp. vulgaris]